MRLNAAIALKADGPVDIVIERILHLLREVDPDVGIDLRAVGSEFGLRDPPNILAVLADAERLRSDLLRRFWRHRERRWLVLALRLAHTMGSMEIGRIRGRMDEIESLIG
jgi:hypothetical protein